MNSPSSESPGSVRPPPLAPGLASWIWPLPCEQFLEAWWQQRPFHSRGTPRRLRQLLASLGVYRCADVAARYPGPVSVNLRRPDGIQETVHMAAHEALERYRRGSATLYFVDAHRAFPGLQAWIDELGRALDIPSTGSLAVASLFISSRDSGFPAHFDKNENFVVHLRGRKRWRLAPNTHVSRPTANYQEDPLRELSLYSRKEEEPRPPAQAEEVILRPGDILYVPRGWWHETRAETRETASITFTFVSLTWADALLPVLRRLLLRHEPWREQAQGLRGSRPDVARIRERLAALLEALPRQVAVLSTEDLLPLAESMGMPSPAATARYCRNPLASITLLAASQDIPAGYRRAEVVVPSLSDVRGAHVTLPEELVPAVVWLNQRMEPFSARETSAETWGRSEPAVSELLQALTSAGFLGAR